MTRRGRHKQILTALIAAATLWSLCGPAAAVNDGKRERFLNNEPMEPIARSRTDEAQAASQVPGAAAVLLEALRWRGRTAKQIGLPSQLWCADFMNFVLKRAGSKGTQSRAARSFLKYGRILDGPRVGAIAVLYRHGANNGHVGVVRGTDGNGNPIIVSGNHGNMVMQSVYPKARVLAYVMPPDYVLQDMASAASGTPGVAAR
ncbi:MAG TPA: TIGR02594 family protein [Pseudolabrys sp.]|nr:TIGR02594 family protein [Pseudolabrys sp.]